MGKLETVAELFKGRHFDRGIVILCVRWYLRFKLSLRDLVEMMAERGLSMAHTTIMRWVQRYAPQFEKRWRRFARPVGRSWRLATKAAADPTVHKAGILDMARLYLNGADPRSPLAAPIYADLTGLAPLLIQVGAAETLLDDAIRLAKVAGAADVRVDLQIWPEMIHVWHLYHPELRAGVRAIEEGGSFVLAILFR